MNGDLPSSLDVTQSSCNICCHVVRMRKNIVDVLKPGEDLVCDDILCD